MLKLSLLMSLLFFFQSLSAQEQKLSPDARSTHAEIKKTFGFVPTQFKEFPQEGITGAWTDWRRLYLSSESRIPRKYKDLMALAVTSLSPCHNCKYFYRQMAKFDGTSPEEIREAVAIASSVSKWSAFLHGTQMDLDKFQSDVNQMLSLQNKNKNRQAMEEKPVVLMINDSRDAYADIERTLGLVPSYMKNYPQESIGGAWKELKGVEFNPASNIPAYYKSLIGLAVAAQIPCAYFSYYFTQSAIYGGVKLNEIRETAALAGLFKQWNINISGVEEKKSKSETDQMLKFLRGQPQKNMTVKR